MKQTVCPKCFARLEAESLSYSCTHEGCERAGIPTPPLETRQEEGKSLCTACNSLLTERLCPNCGYPIQDQNDAPTLTISIVGGEGCGKSNYLSVLVDQLRHQLSKVYDCSLYPLGGDQTIHHYESLYYRPLFEEGRCLISTSQDEVTPLLYSLVFSGKGAKGKTCNIALYDACGANFKSEQKMADYNRSVYNGQGILFFIDPSQLPAIRERWEEEGLPIRQEDVFALLSRTIRLVRQGMSNKNVKTKLDVPIAVCLTKVDMVKKLLDPSSFLQYPSRHLLEPRFDTPDFSSVSLEVMSLIESWSGVEIINQVTSQFNHYGFFGLSALGVQPDDKNQVQMISPHRVLDPILWVLWKNKIIG